ncbi:MAG: hypothetical protein R2795_02035 [Saprospiraceae bacterium]
MADIIDTNVIAVSNFENENVRTDCLEACINYLSSYTNRTYAVDSENRIFNEYFRYARRAGTPNVGDAFAAWLWNNQANPNFCELVTITESGDEVIVFNEIPFNEELLGFDKADQKFLAVAIACTGLGNIVNATDSDWNQYREAVQNTGVQVTELCPDTYSVEG